MPELAACHMCLPCLGLSVATFAREATFFGCCLRSLMSSCITEAKGQMILGRLVIQLKADAWLCCWAYCQEAQSFPLPPKSCASSLFWRCPWAHLCVTIQGKDGEPHQLELSFSQAGVATDLAILQAASAWKQLTDASKGWTGITLTSTLELASVWDILLWCCWAKHHPANKRVWKDICEPLWAKIVFLSGSLLETFALHLATLVDAALPLLKRPRLQIQSNMSTVVESAVCPCCSCTAVCLLPRVAKEQGWKHSKNTQGKQDASGKGETTEKASPCQLGVEACSLDHQCQETMQTHANLVSRHAALVTNEKVTEACCYMQHLASSLHWSFLLMPIGQLLCKLVLLLL